MCLTVVFTSRFYHGVQVHVPNQCHAYPGESLRNSSVTRASKGQIMDHKGNVNECIWGPFPGHWGLRQETIPGRKISSTFSRACFYASFLKEIRMVLTSPGFVLLFYFFCKDHSDVICDSARDMAALAGFWTKFQGLYFLTGYLHVV